MSVVALDEFTDSPTTEVTVVDRAGRRYTPNRQRRPDDGRVDRIRLKAGEEEATFVGEAAWQLAALMMKNWGYRCKLGRPTAVTFFVRFGDGVTYSGTLYVSRSKRPDLAAYCRTIEAFQASFAPDLQHRTQRTQVRAMFRTFLTTYEIPTATAKIAAILTFTSTH